MRPYPELLTDGQVWWLLALALLVWLIAHAAWDMCRRQGFTKEGNGDD